MCTNGSNVNIWKYYDNSAKKEPEKRGGGEINQDGSEQLPRCQSQVESKKQLLGPEV